MPPLPLPPSRSVTSTPDRSHVAFQQSSQRKNPPKSKKLLRRFKSVFRSFPIINPPCRMPSSLSHGNHFKVVGSGGSGRGEKRLTGTLFGYRKTRVNLVFQENPRCLPILVLELSLQTGKLLQVMGMGLVRIALECDKCRSDKAMKLMDEPIWTMYCNRKKTGYGVKREPTEGDLTVIQTLSTISMGAFDKITNEGELTYMRANFERVTGSKDSETYYMLDPDGNSGPELSIFFVRLLSHFLHTFIILLEFESILRSVDGLNG